MSWTCGACEFSANEDDQGECAACGSERPKEHQQEGERGRDGSGAFEAMAWTCAACEYWANEGDACIACGSGRPEEEEGPQEKDNDSGNCVDPTIEVIELAAMDKLGVKLRPPKDDVIDHGLAIDSISNPLLENKVQAGDVIVAIGGRNVNGMGLSDAIDLIRKMPRPLAISFEIDEARRQNVARAKQANRDYDLGTLWCSTTGLWD
jgi:hypothetical protein